MNVICVFLDEAGKAFMRPPRDVADPEAIHLYVLWFLANQIPLRWTFVVAFEPGKPVACIADLASYNAWQPTEQQERQVRSWLIKDELDRLRRSAAPVTGT